MPYANIGIAKNYRLKIDLLKILCDNKMMILDYFVSIMISEY